MFAYRDKNINHFFLKQINKHNTNCNNFIY